MLRPHPRPGVFGLASGCSSPRPCAFWNRSALLSFYYCVRYFGQTIRELGTFQFSHDDALFTICQNSAVGRPAMNHESWRLLSQEGQNCKGQIPFQRINYLKLKISRRLKGGIKLDKIFLFILLLNRPIMKRIKSVTKKIYKRETKGCCLRYNMATRLCV